MKLLQFRISFAVFRFVRGLRICQMGGVFVDKVDLVDGMDEVDRLRSAVCSTKASSELQAESRSPKANSRFPVLYSAFK